MIMEHGISIIICCYNSASRIKRVLKYLLSQRNCEDINYEIILVDNASDDNTHKIANQAWTGDKSIFKIIDEKKPGLSYARMAGLAEARYEIINFIDDDNFVEPEWLFKIHQIMTLHPEVAMCGGLGIPEFEGEKPPWFDNFQDAFAVGPQGEETGVIRNRMYLHGAGITIRKKIWRELKEKEFHFHLSGRKGKKLSSGEDYELSVAVQMLGYKLYYKTDLVFYHLMPNTRLNDDYILKLYKAFGRASVITQIYRSLLLKEKGINKLKSQNYFISILFAFYKYMNINIFLKRCKKEDMNKLAVKTQKKLWEKNFLFKLSHPIAFYRIVNSIKKFAYNCER